MSNAYEIAENAGNDNTSKAIESLQFQL